MTSSQAIDHAARAQQPLDSPAVDAGAAGHRRSRLKWLGRGPLVGTASIASGIVAWWLWAISIHSDLLPTPAEVVRTAGHLFADGSLEADIRASVVRVLIGFGLGVAVAVPVGFLMGWYRIVRAVVEPYVQFVRTIPPLALIPLVILVLGIGETAKVLVIALAVFLVCVIATFQGVVSVDRTTINAARVLGAGDVTLFWRVVIPASSPYIIVGMRVGLGAAWTTLVAAELIAAQHGLGRMIQQAALYFDVPTILVGLFCIGVLGFLMDRLLLLLERRLTSWQERR